MDKKLTVTIPSYRQPKELHRALVALSHQTFRDFDVVIIDDNSGVDVESIANQFKDKLSIRVHTNEKNFGAMKNLEFSINFPCTSQYILSHHEDDFLVSNYLEEAVKILDEEKGVAFVVAAPVWAKREQEFVLETIVPKPPTLYTATEFMEASLSRAPFMFGSIVYRRSNLAGNFDLENYYTLCDKIYLNTILINSSSKAAFISQGAIYITDHSQDEKDTRSTDAKDTHLINCFLFYKKHLPDTFRIKKLITNGLLLGFINLPGRHSFTTFLKKCQRSGLLSFYAIDLVGIYSLLAVIFGKKIMNQLLKNFSRIKHL